VEAEDTSNWGQVEGRRARSWVRGEIADFHHEM